MTLANHETVDFIIASPDGKTLCLVTVATEPLMSENGELANLEAKLHFYRHAIVSGQVDSQFPQFKETRKVVRIGHYANLTDGARTILAAWAMTLAEDGIGLETEQHSFNPIKLLFNLFKKSAPTVWNPK